MLRIFYMLILLVSANNILAQITIGSLEKPESGALLQLKEAESSNVNSTKGLLMPRVKLTDKYNLYPMFEESPGSGTPQSNYVGDLKKAEDARHVGLSVYSSDNCDGIIAKGLHVWTGLEWVQMTQNEAMGKPQIFVNGEGDDQNSDVVIHIPSGKDLRPFTADHTFDIGWKTKGLTVSKNAVNNTIVNGTFFSGNTPESWANQLSDNPTSYSFSVNSMQGLPGIDFTNPWQSRETQIEFLTSADDCGVQAKRTVILNQTNYALQFQFNSANDTRDTDFNFLIKEKYGSWDAFYLSPKSNAQWKATYREQTPGILASANIPAIGGQENTQGVPFISRVTPKRAETIESIGKYKIAGTITFRDAIPAPNHRFDSITVTIIRCQGRPNMSPVTIDGDVVDESQWGNQVVKHTDQDGNVFYSAAFGNAGRWMVTNLAAKSYDDGEVQNEIFLHNNDTTSRRSYAYPRLIEGGEIGSGSWDKPDTWQLEQGLLYTWYAAANKDESELTNINQGQEVPGVDLEPGDKEIEKTGDKGQGNKRYIQGICPKGWHLPSDREFNRLEKEIYNNPGQYSMYSEADIAKFSPLKWDENFETFNGRRGSASEGNKFGHGGAMKEMCSVDDLSWNWMRTSKGYSKEPAYGGFNVLHLGLIEGSKINYYGYDGAFWTSSRNYERSWSRTTNYEDPYVRRYGSKRFSLFSVRCVRNY